MRRTAEVSIYDCRDMALEFGTLPTHRFNFKPAWEFEQDLLGQRLITAQHSACHRNRKRMTSSIRLVHEPWSMASNVTRGYAPISFPSSPSIRLPTCCCWSNGAISGSLTATLASSPAPAPLGRMSLHILADTYGNRRAIPFVYWHCIGPPQHRRDKPNAFHKRQNRI